MYDLIHKHIALISSDIAPDQLNAESSLNTLGFDSMKYLILLYKICEDLDLDMMELDPNEIAKIDKLHELESFLTKVAPGYVSNSH
jgi:acyl carrier protein